MRVAPGSRAPDPQAQWRVAGATRILLAAFIMSNMSNVYGPPRRVAPENRGSSSGQQALTRQDDGPGVTSSGLIRASAGRSGRSAAMPNVCWREDNGLDHDVLDERDSTVFAAYARLDNGRVLAAKSAHVDAGIPYRADERCGAVDWAGGRDLGASSGCLAGAVDACAPRADSRLRRNRLFSGDPERLLSPGSPPSLSPAINAQSQYDSVSLGRPTSLHLTAPFCAGGRAGGDLYEQAVDEIVCAHEAPVEHCPGAACDSYIPGLYSRTGP